MTFIQTDEIYPAKLFDKFYDFMPISNSIAFKITGDFDPLFFLFHISQSHVAIFSHFSRSFKIKIAKDRPTYKQDTFFVINILLVFNVRCMGAESEGHVVSQNGS